MPTGPVKWFSSTRGFGFSAPDGGGKDIFLQSAAEERAGLKSLNDTRSLPSNCSRAGTGAGLRASCACFGWALIRAGHRGGLTGKQESLPPARAAYPASAGGPKPTASARPAPGGRFPPAGSGAGLCWCGWHGSWWHRSARAGETHAFQGPARSGADRQTPNHQRRCHGRGHRPCHSAPLIPGPPGAQSPRPAPAPPPAGASRPPGRALASAIPGPADLQGTVPHGRGNAVRFPIPPAPTNAPSPMHWQGPSPLPLPNSDTWPAGGQCPPRPRRALPARRVGRWPALCLDLPIHGEPSRTGGGNAVRFGVPPGEALAMPECPVSLAGVIAPATASR
jgi:CspA family cold shock protein